MANQLDGSVRNQEMEQVLFGLVKVLQDSQNALVDVGEHLKDENLKLRVLAESLKRANFRAELENELHRAGVADVSEEGTTAGTLHRVWGDVKALLGSSDHSLLETADAAEHEVMKAYAEALAQELPLPLRELLDDQQEDVLLSHEYIKKHRDAALKM